MAASSPTGGGAESRLRSPAEPTGRPRLGGPMATGVPTASRRGGADALIGDGRITTAAMHLHTLHPPVPPPPLPPVSSPTRLALPCYPVSQHLSGLTLWDVSEQVVPGALRQISAREQDLRNKMGRQGPTAADHVNDRHAP